MDLEEGIITYSVNLLTEGDCNTNQLIHDLDCLYSKIGDESMFLFDGLEGAYKEAAVYYILEIQKIDEYLGAFCELLYRLNTDDYNELTTDINTEEIKKQIELEVNQEIKKVNKPNTKALEDPIAYKENNQEGGLPTQNGLRQRLTRQPTSGTTAQGPPPATSNPLADAMNNGIAVMQGTVPSYKVRRIERLLVKLRFPQEKVKVWAPMLVKAWSFIKTAGIFIASGLPNRIPIIPYVYSIPVGENLTDRLIDNIDLATCSKYELNQYLLTMEFYSEAIYTIQEKASRENRKLTPNETKTINDITETMKRRKQLHEEFKKYRSKNFLVQVVLRSTLTTFRNIINLFLFSWVGAPLLDAYTSILGVGLTVTNFSITVFLQIISKIFNLGDFLVNLYSGLVTGFSTIGTLAWNFPFIPNGIIETAQSVYQFLSGQGSSTVTAGNRSVANIASTGIQYATNFIGSTVSSATGAVQHLANRGVSGIQQDITSMFGSLPQVYQQLRSGDFSFIGEVLGTRSIGSIIIQIRNLLIRYSTAILFFLPASSFGGILFVCFLISLAYNYSIYSQKQKISDETKKVLFAQQARAMNLNRSRRYTSDPTTWWTDESIEAKAQKAYNAVIENETKRLEREQKASSSVSTTTTQSAQPLTAIARTAQETTRSMPYFAFLGTNIFGGKRRTHYRRRGKVQKKRKSTTRRH